MTRCSPLFDADGAGLEFVAYETADFRSFGENPFLLRAEMRRVVAPSLASNQARHAGRLPQPIPVHKTTEFKRHEVEGAFDALSGTLRRSTCFRSSRMQVGAACVSTRQPRTVHAERKLCQCL